MKTFIIAEAGSVHDGSFGNALKLCNLAKKSGADAIKFQMHIANEETLKNAPSPSHFKSESRFSYFNRTSFSIDQWKKIKMFCNKIKIEFFVSVFSEKAVEISKKLKLKYIKIPSGEVTNLPLLKKISKTNMIKILSTGMSDFSEIGEAVKFLGKKVVIMQCTSLYPTINKFVGLNVIKDLKKKFPKCKIGLSDHSNNNAAAIGAVVCGAKYIEKHITFSNEMYGSDAKFAYEPKNFLTYCSEIKNIAEIINNPVNKNDLRKFKKIKEVYQKSLVTKKSIKKGDKLNSENLAIKKPGKGIPAKFYYKILNKVAKKNIKKDKLIKWQEIK